MYWIHGEEGCGKRRQIRCSQVSSLCKTVRNDFFDKSNPDSLRGR